MDLPFSHDELVRATTDVIEANGLTSCYVRPIAFRGYGEMGVNPLNAPIDVSIAVWPWGAYLGEEALEQGVRIKIGSWRRNSQNALPAAAKADGQYINSVLAKVESLKAGYDEAIMLNEAGFVTDGSGENVFIVRDGVLFTPPTQAGCLDGITRGTVITLAREREYVVREENLVRTDLYNADECFFTGTAAELTPIREVDDRQVGAGHRGAVTRSCRTHSSPPRRARIHGTPSGSPTSTTETCVDHEPSTDSEATYRLPRAVTPSRYDLTLQPSLDTATFDGHEAIAVTVHEPVTEIVLNAKELEVLDGSLEAADGSAIDLRRSSWTRGPNG